MKTANIMLSAALLAGTCFPVLADRELHLEWVEKDGKQYWYENGEIQGKEGDDRNITDEIYGIERGREIYDPASDAWYWLDANDGGAKAVNKEFWMPYVYQDETPGSTEGKWVRYDEEGKMIKGWYAEGMKVYYYDQITGAMAKGDMHTISYAEYRINPELMEQDLAYGFDSVFGTLSFDAGYSYYSGNPAEDGAASLFFVHGHNVSHTRTTFLLNSEWPGLFLGAYEKINVPVDGWHFRLTDEDWEKVENCEWMLYLDTDKNAHIFEPVWHGSSTITEENSEIIYYDRLDYSGLDQTLFYLCRKTSEEVNRHYDVDLIGFREIEG